MSTPAGTGPQVPAAGKPKRGLSKYVAKFKKALASSDGSKRLSLSGAPKTTAATGEASASKPKASTTEPTPAVEEIKEATKTTAEPEIKIYSKAELDAERAKKLTERFKLSLEDNEWPISVTTDVQVRRVEKPIRMRVHRTCHRCGASFGANKTCVGCEHTKCTKCPRYPGKKTKTQDVKSPEPVVAAKTEEQDLNALKEKFVLTMPSRTGGQPLVRKKPKQRVRRTCHSCATLFMAGTKECSSCGHVRCEDCPRDPAKKNKYPDGYPGDEPSANPTRPKKFICGDCKNMFEVSPQTNTDTPPDCSHCQSSKTSRAKPKKVIPAPDPEVLKSVQAKLAALAVSS